MVSGGGWKFMPQKLIRLTLAGLFCAALSACAAPDYGNMPNESGNTVIGAVHAPLQCVPYARAHSDVKLHGDAFTWWDKAAGRWTREARPRQGAVMVLDGYAGRARAHLAVVRRIVSDREIRVDHANWLDDGAIYLNDPVMDVSPGNDWSKVRVWNIKTGAWGGRTYPVRGFIGPQPAGDSRLASTTSKPYY